MGQSAAARTLERILPRDRTAQDQRVDIVRAFVGVDRLEVHRVAHHVHLAGDTHTARAPTLASVRASGLTANGNTIATRRRRPAARPIRHGRAR